MSVKKFTLQGEYIELIKLLKYLNIAENGAHAKWMVDEGLVILNGIKENRKRAKIRSDDVIQVGEWIIEVS
ncbi:MAG: RNA-binding S4 domain-containing protein [Bacteroidales bacterium]|nr:RNA-binding S4 domain-containing protein [Bacteroidales bacterium]